MQYFSEEHSAEVVKQQYENCKNLRLKKNYGECNKSSSRICEGS